VLACRQPESVTVDPGEYTRFGDWLSETYSVIAVANQGAVHDYLGMIFDFSVKGKVMINMIEYIKNITANFPEEIAAIRTSPAADHLFTVRDKFLAKLLPEEQARAFHHASGKLLFLSARARRDIQPKTGFLTTQVKCSRDEHGARDGPELFTEIKIHTKRFTEAKLVRMDDSLGYILWARYFMQEQGFDMEALLLYQDNMSAMLLKTNGRASSSKLTKHIKVKYFFIKDKVD
jgi:hypothetical protein